MKKSEFNYFVSLLEEKVGWRITDKNLFLINTKIDIILRKFGYPDIKTLISEMKNSPNLFLWQVIEAIAPLRTCFYRDYSVVRGFENILLPYLQEQNYATKKIKILVLGCSTGQEAYSIAMSIRKKIKDFDKWNIDITGVDISTEAILKAQKGYYNQFEIQNGLNARYIIENFKNTGSYWQANKDLVDMVKFQRSNICDKKIIDGKYDLVFCRNVLTIFTPEAQADVIKRIFENQVEAGFLCVGLNERINGLENFYDASDIECIYRAKNTDDTKIKEKQHQEIDDMPSFERPDNLKMMKIIGE